jgi:AmmeMemoRadiSam system protein B
MSPGRAGIVGPNVAGTFYPGDARTLAGDVDRRIDASAPASDGQDGRLLALVSPHAGYIYSGDVAAAGFRLLRGRGFERAIVLGPSHYVSYRGGAVPDASSYRTPLGDVPLDEKAIESLAARTGFRLHSAPFEREHSIEVEIPFLQRTLAPGWVLLPVLVGPMTEARDAQDLAAALSEWIDDRTVVVASSDFTHYGRQFDYVPFSTGIEEGLRRLDHGAIDRILSGDVAAFEAYVRETGATICGRNAIGVLVRMLGRRAEGALLAYDTSGRITSDWRHSVSYASLAFRSGTEAR